MSGADNVESTCGNYKKISDCGKIRKCVDSLIPKRILRYELI